MGRLSEEKQKLMEDAFLKYPMKSDCEISKITKISQPTIGKHRKKHALSVDTQFISMVAGKFIYEFSQAINHWKLLIQEIEDLKDSKKTIFKKGTDGNYYPEEVDLEAIDKLALIKEQANLRARILFLASQGEVREVIKLMRSGQLPPLPQPEPEPIKTGITAASLCKSPPTTITGGETQ